MGRPSKFSPEVQDRAVRMVPEHGGEHDSQWAGDPVDCRQNRLYHGDNGIAQENQAELAGSEARHKSNQET